jgi:hypothetical protein
MSLSFSSHIPVFDANVGVGHRHNRRYPFDSPDQLLAEMARHGIDRSLVYAIQGELISPIQGNESLGTWTDGNDELIPQLVAGCDRESMDQLKGIHQDSRITSVRLHNTTESRIPFVPWIYGDLLTWLCAEHIPCWISLADTPPTEVVDTLIEYPNLTTVLVGANYTHSNMIRPMLRTLPSAFLELSRYENICGVEKLVQEFGADRLLYGSYFPRYAMGPILFGLYRRSISDGDLRSICATNLERILGLDKPTQ